MVSQLLFEIIGVICPNENNYFTNPEKYKNLIDIVHTIAASGFNSINPKAWKAIA